MTDLRFTLVSDGSSDRALIPILRWLLRSQNVNCAIQSEWADLRRLPDPPRSLSDKIAKSLELYPCDLLFVHRDAEIDTRKSRISEIETALDRAGVIPNKLPVVCVVPVRMQEAWLLFNEAAIRRAAGNPNGTQALELPPLKMAELLPDPKKVLHELLLAASGLRGRRLKAFRVNKHAAQVSSFVTDFAPLQALSAFRNLEADLSGVVRSKEWDSEREVVD